MAPLHIPNCLAGRRREPHAWPEAVRLWDEDDACFLKGSLKLPEGLAVCTKFPALPLQAPHGGDTNVRLLRQLILAPIQQGPAARNCYAECRGLLFPEPHPRTVTGATDKFHTLCFECSS